MKTVLNLTDAACYLRLRERQLIDLANKGKVPYRKVGKEFYFDQAELDAWWDAQPGHKIPVTLRDPQPEPTRPETSPDGPNHAAIPFIRGARRHKQAPSLPQQT